MVLINFIDGEHIEVFEDTILNGYRKTKDDGSEFYLANVYSNSIDSQLSKEASRLSTVNPKIGISGFLLSVDCFSLGLDTENNVLYFTSSIKSVENSNG